MKSHLLSDEEVRKLVAARLSILSPHTIISLGSQGNFTRDQLMARVKEGDEIGEKIAEVQLAWLRSFKEGVAL